jgi:hypothetical protein
MRKFVVVFVVFGFCHCQPYWVFPGVALKMLLIDLTESVLYQKIIKIYREDILFSLFIMTIVNV